MAPLPAAEIPRPDLEGLGHLRALRKLTSRQAKIGATAVLAVSAEETALCGWQACTAVPSPAGESGSADEFSPQLVGQRCSPQSIWCCGVPTYTTARFDFDLIPFKAPLLLAAPRHRGMLSGEWSHRSPPDLWLCDSHAHQARPLPAACLSLERCAIALLLVDLDSCRLPVSLYNQISPPHWVKLWQVRVSRSLGFLQAFAGIDQHGGLDEAPAALCGLISQAQTDWRMLRSKLPHSESPLSQ